MGILLGRDDRRGAGVVSVVLSDVVAAGDAVVWCHLTAVSATGGHLSVISVSAGRYVSFC